MGVTLPPLDLGSLLNDVTGSGGTNTNGVIPPFLGTTPPSNKGNSSAEAISNPTIIIEPGNSNLTTYLLIGLGVIALVGLIILGRRRSGGGGGHKGHK